MKKILAMSSLFLLSASFAASPVDRKIDACSGNVTCIAKVLAELISSQNTSSIVEFYHDDGHCEFGNLLARVPLGTPVDDCRKRAESVTNRVWGVKVDGACHNISDMDFVDACIKYATMMQSFPK